MNTKTFFKKSIFLFFAIGAIVMLNFILMQGDFAFARRTSITMAAPTNAMRGSAEGKQTESLENIQTESFTVSSHDKEGIFRKGVPIDVVCTIKNSSLSAIKNFRSLIRIPGKDIVSIKTSLLKPDASLRLEGSFTPEDSGVVIIACRSDIDGNVEEKSENDNREIKALYIW